LLSRMKQQEYPYPSSVADYNYPIEHHLTYPPEDSIEKTFW
jgi:hypothetical protein